MLNQNPAQVPFFIQFDEIQTAFVHLRLYIDTSDLDPQLRRYLELYFEIIFEVPLIRNGEEWSRTRVVETWNELAVDYSSQIGYNGDSNFTCGSYAQLLVINVTCLVRPSPL